MFFQHFGAVSTFICDVKMIWRFLSSMLVAITEMVQKRQKTYVYSYGAVTIDFFINTQKPT